MRRDPKFHKMLRDATREAAQDLDNLKIVTPQQSAGLAMLKHELRKSLAKDHESIASEARSTWTQAKQSSARHRAELMQMKITAHEAAASLSVARTQRRPTKATKDNS